MKMSFYLCSLLFAHGGVATLGSTVSMLPPRRAYLAAGQREPRDFINCHSLAPAAFHPRSAAPNYSAWPRARCTVRHRGRHVLQVDGRGVSQDQSYTPGFCV